MDGRVKKRTVATFGRLDQLRTDLESVITGSMRVTGSTLPERGEPLALRFESARGLSDLWNSLSFERLR